MSTRATRRVRQLTIAAAVAALTVPVAAAVGSSGSRYRDRGHTYASRHWWAGRDGLTFATIKAPQGQTLVVFGHRGRRTVRLRGLAAGERVVGIDVRPANNVLYGVSSANRVFTIDPRTGQTANAQTLSVPLNGNAFGVDFNPSVDRLRIVSDNDQNLRVNVDTGMTTSDPSLAYPAGDRNAGRDPAVTALGYTFAALGGPTALYDVDSATDTFDLQNPPNAGTLNSIGPIGVDVGSQAGLDIAGRDRFTAFGLFQQGNRANLYELRFDRNGRASKPGAWLPGQYDGLAVLNAYSGRS